MLCAHCFEAGYQFSDTRVVVFPNPLQVQQDLFTPFLRQVLNELAEYVPAFIRSGPEIPSDIHDHNSLYLSNSHFKRHGQNPHSALRQNKSETIKTASYTASSQYFRAVCSVAFFQPHVSSAQGL